MPLLIALFGALMSALGLFTPDGGGGDGGAGAGDGGDAGGSGDAGRAANGAGDSSDDSARNGQGDAGDGDGQDPAQQRGTTLTDPAALQREVDEARRQAAAERTKRTTAEQERTQALEAFKPIAKLLGFETGDDPDPAQLQAKLEQTQAELRAERINSTFLRVASQAGANPELTLRYLRGGNELDDLDPAAPEFEGTLKSIVQAAISSTPALKAEAPQAGGSFDGGARGGGTPAEPEDLAGLIAHRVTQQRRAQA